MYDKIDPWYHLLFILGWSIVQRMFPYYFMSLLTCRRLCLKKEKEKRLLYFLLIHGAIDQVFPFAAHCSKDCSGFVCLFVFVVIVVALSVNI